MKKGYQFVWFPGWCGFWFRRYDPSKTDLAYIYAWIIGLGFVQVRKWSVLHAPPR